ncbi:hypothetical protein OV079_08075 [Nannocystis pusilla]|uniref:Uncharacterized protein n=1 Tax=Nannocystis pusilla TaxID=889268 RepID=A0A9X3EK29_9BACT|nr:hypothetical protein [Nannocystis pusilla]MCY1005528.1 hypothetical protein [Nannocystis pusilla]
MQVPVLKQHAEAGVRDHGLLEVEEVSLAAGEVLVEVDHEGQQAALVLGADAGAVEVRGEPLAGVVAVAAEALVDAEDGHGADLRRHRGPGPFEQQGGELGVVEDDALVGAELGTQHRGAQHGDRGAHRTERLDAIDQRGALVGREHVVDGPDRRV